MTSLRASFGELQYEGSGLLLLVLVQTVRTWHTLPAPSQTHSWWDLDSARAALCHTTAFSIYGQNFYLFGCMEN